MSVLRVKARHVFLRFTRKHDIVTCFLLSKLGFGQNIPEYGPRPMLGDVLSVDYRNRIKKMAEAWKSLAEEMGKEFAEVHRKMHNLRN